MLDIASLGNGLVGPSREVHDSPPVRAISAPPSRPGDRLESGPGPRSIPSVDRVEVSEHAGLMARLAEIPDVRWDRVNSAREAIQDNDYVDRHIDEAIDRLLNDF